MMPKGIRPQCLSLSCPQLPITGPSGASSQTFYDPCLARSLASGPCTLLVDLYFLLKPSSSSQPQHPISLTTETLQLPKPLKSHPI